MTLQNWLRQNLGCCSNVCGATLHAVNTEGTEVWVPQAKTITATMVPNGLPVRRSVLPSPGVCVGAACRKNQLLPAAVLLTIGQAFQRTSLPTARNPLHSVLQTVAAKARLQLHQANCRTDTTLLPRHTSKFKQCVTLFKFSKSVTSRSSCSVKE